MNKITLKNFRCFHDEQKMRLAPLTLLVGENSTGKTSFMAMIRALCYTASGFLTPNFKREPYDLGSFDDIAHRRGAKGSQATTFSAGFEISPPHKTDIFQKSEPYKFGVTFEKKGTTPVPVTKNLSCGKLSIVENIASKHWTLCVHTSKGSWKQQLPINEHSKLTPSNRWRPFIDFMFALDSTLKEPEKAKLMPLAGSPAFPNKDSDLLQTLAVYSRLVIQEPPFASAPVRSKPRRTYDPARLTRDPEGDYVPMYLASLSFQDEARWEKLKDKIETFGRNSGLFNEIFIKPLGKKDSEPFQIQLRKFGGKRKGPKRNLIDMGYGVSQVLPLITELLRQDSPNVFLLQQPEVHLHPSAQAALGTLFCQIAAQKGRQLIVETHSDYLLDRVRMEVRDGTAKLKPDDVSILYFERDDLDVKIYSIRLDKEGNVLDAPNSYRKFFMDETKRSIGI